MSKLLNAMKEKFNHLKQNVMLRTILISVLALLLIFSVTFAWYINNLGMWGMEFNTGNIDFNAYVYSENGTKLAGPVSPDDENLGQYMNLPLCTIQNAQVGSVGTVYIVVESTGSIGIDYRLAFDVSGKSDKATAYLGGYKYNISKVNDKVTFTGANKMDVGKCPRPDSISDEIVTIDRNAVNGTVQNKNGYDVYRFDYTLVNKNEEYTGNGINIYFNVFATQVGGDFEDTQERGFTYYCSTKEDLDRAKVEAYPGDIIRLTSDIVYYGDLVFNKPISLETNDFTLTVNGNLMYDYVLGNSLRLDAGGLGRIVVQCTKEGVGGNLQIKAPLSDVILNGSNASIGDIVVEKNITVDATKAFGSPGITFNNTRIVDEKNSRKTIMVESNTRVTVAFGTTIGLLQSTVNANNIEIVNNGVIGDINLANMALLDQTNSPQIYILNNNTINNPIALPAWSEKFVDKGEGVCTGNTRIIQSYSGSQMTVVGNCPFTDRHIEVEFKETLVAQIQEGNDSRLKIYYQDVDGQKTSIQSILENYLRNEATTGCTLNEILQLDIISIDNKAITNEDIAFMNGSSMLALRHLDMQRAHIYDSYTNTYHRLADNAFNGVDKYEYLILPQNLEQIGNSALANTKVDNCITVPAGVTSFGNNWFMNGLYVGFASSVPLEQATGGMRNVKAIFVEEPYINSYRNVYYSYYDRIYPVSVLDESKEHFVRNTKKNEWEITYYIRGEDAVIGENITIDGTLLNITSVYDYAYRHNYTTSVVRFADSVENLGAGNFTANKNVTYVDLNRIKTLGDEVFSNCVNLTKTVFSDRLETIGNNAFSSCQAMKQEVILPVTMQTIGASAFQGTPITKVHTGGAVSVASRAFYVCGQLVSAEMPNVKVACETGENDLFGYCESLVSVSMPSLVRVNGRNMFAGCASLRELYMGADDETVSLGITPFTSCDRSKIKLFVPEEKCSYYAEQLFGVFAANMIYPTGEKMGEELVNGFNIGQYIVMNNGDNTYALVTSNTSHSGNCSVPTEYKGNPITKIYTNCFRNQSFTDVKMNIGNNIKEIGDFAFYALNGLHEVKFGNSLELLGKSCFAQCMKLVQDIELPATMRFIDNSAFNASGITGINTGGTQSIESLAFASCGNLTYAKCPEVTVIGPDGEGQLFGSCDKLVSVEVPKLTTVNGRFMFQYCSSLRELVMGSTDPNVTLGSFPFVNASTTCLKLYVPADAISFYSDRRFVSNTMLYPIGEKVGNKSVNGFVIGDYIVSPNGNGYILSTSNLDYSGDVTVPEMVNGKPITEIYANAFRNQTFENVNLSLSDQVKVIQEGAFSGLFGLKSVKMDGVTTIGNNAFYGSGIQILNGLKITSIGAEAFATCDSLEIVNLPKVVRIESNSVFYHCDKLRSIYFEDILFLHDSTLEMCNKLEKITINRLILSDKSNMPSEFKISGQAACKIYVPYRSLSAYPVPWSNKLVVSFDKIATYNEDTYILSENKGGQFVLIDFVPGKTGASLTVPSTVTADGVNITVYGIQSGAFSAVTGTLKNLTLPSSVAMLDNAALSECTTLENIYVDSASRFFKSVNGVLYSKDGKLLVKYPSGRSGDFDMTGTGYSSTVVIGSKAFMNATKLTKIKFPASLLVIDSTSFENCTKLKTVEFTGNTPPVLMGSGIFDTSIEGFNMVIPTSSSSVVTAYLCGYNFSEYEAFINRGGHAAPGANTDRNKVSIG